MTISPLAPKNFIIPNIISGIKLGCSYSGLKYINRDDLLIISLPKNSIVCGVFTKSSVASPAVDLCKKNLYSNNRLRAIVVNAGNANVFNGLDGEKAISKIINKTASSLDISSNEILIAQTGVIGEQFNYKNVINSIDNAVKNLRSDNWISASKAIMTTDTFHKVASLKCKIGEKNINITGIAKGSGMIAPNMATMLSFIMTDANLNKTILQKCLNHALEDSFNSITVDSDTSTSDSLILGSSCNAKNIKVNSFNDKILDDFKITLKFLCQNLAKQVVCDGEGASKLVTIRVSGDKNFKDLKTIAFSVANSPLVKTAISAGDPNWGRVIMAIGKTQLEINPKKITLYIGKFLITKNGERTIEYNENKVQEYMKNNQIELKIIIGNPLKEVTVWTCDFTKEYIDINSSYRS